MAASLLPVDASAQGRRGGSRGGAVGSLDRCDRAGRPRRQLPSSLPALLPTGLPVQLLPLTGPYYYGGYGYYRSYPYWWGSYGWSPYWSPYWGSYYGYGYPYYWGGYYRRYDPSDALGAARLQVTPRETEVFVDGYFAGVVDDFDGFAQRLRLEPGEHEVTLFLEGHRPLTRKMLFTVGQTFKVQHEMEPLGAGEPAPQRPVPTAKPPAPARTRYGRPGISGRARAVRGGAGDRGPGTGDRDVDVEVIEPPTPNHVNRASRANRGRESNVRRSRTRRAGRRARCRSGSSRTTPRCSSTASRGRDRAASGWWSRSRRACTGWRCARAGTRPTRGLVRIRPGVATTLNVALAPSARRGSGIARPRMRRRGGSAARPPDRRVRAYGGRDRACGARVSAAGGGRRRGRSARRGCRR